MPSLRRLAAAPTWRTATVAAVAASGAALLAVSARRSAASDHQDTAFVEFNARFDVNDVYAFPSPRPGRVVLVLGTTSPITPAGTATAAFGNETEALYQLKVDNTGDAREDVVFQFTFTGPPGSQRVRLRAPAVPNEVGTANTLVAGARELEGPVGQTLGDPGGLQLFAGPRGDPFFLDLEAFFAILPDRRPESGPLSRITQGPLTFRPPGQARDFFRGINDLALVVELPLADLTAGGTRPRFGVWGTTSRARTGPR